MSPLQLSIVLWYHAHAEDMPWVNEGAPIRNEIMDGLVAKGLLSRHDEGMRFRPTEKLHAFVEMLCATPLPQSAWCDPRTKEVVAAMSP